MKIGSHVGNNGEEMLLGSLNEALSYDANCFMVYIGPPQNSIRKDISRFRIVETLDLLAKHNMSPADIIIHGPYITNLAQSNDEKRQFAIDFIVKEIEMADKIGAKYYIIHPGSHMGNGIEIGLSLISNSLKEILKKTKETGVNILIETMAGKGSECCFAFEHIKKLIDYVSSPRIGVCLDTCHINDAGYDIVNDYEGVIKKFDDIVGIDKIKVIHINDSLNNLGAKKDRHANIGFGKVGFDTICKFVYDERFVNVYKILETPYVKEGKDEYPPYKEEIRMIRNRKFEENMIDIIKGK